MTISMDTLSIIFEYLNTYSQLRLKETCKDYNSNLHITKINDRYSLTDEILKNYLLRIPQYVHLFHLPE